MSSKKRYASGSQKRKQKAKEETQTKKLPKITAFFTDQLSTDVTDLAETSKSTEANVEVNVDDHEVDAATDITSNDAEAASIGLSTADGESRETSTSVQTETFHLTDPALWNTTDAKLVDYWIRRGPETCRNRDGKYIKSSRNFKNITRKLNDSAFTKTLPSGQSTPRHWLLYSPSTGRVFCFVCRLFKHNSQSSLVKDGFDAWDHINRLSDHEQSSDHRQALAQYSIRVANKETLDRVLVDEMEKEKNYWREVLKRVVSTVKFLAGRGLAFRGSDEKFGSPNNGNFLGCLELLAEYDPFLTAHIERYGNAGRGTASYISSATCDEFIGMMSSHVMKTILDELKNAKHFAFSVDSTPDITHVDQLTLTVRYVSTNGVPVERFLKFIPISSHTGESLYNVIKTTFEELEIPLADCIGQTYDNASNMSGIYSGLQARVLQDNPRAPFIPCMAHSLNLSGNAAVESCVQSVTFFGVVQKLYVFLSSSTSRWHVLTEKLTTAEGSCTVPKRLSDTRWSARADALNSLISNYHVYVAVLQQIAADPLQNKVTQAEAQSITKALAKLETGFLIAFWSCILTRTNMTSKLLQSEKADLGSSVSLLQSLSEFVGKLREKNKFDELVEAGKKLCGTSQFTEKRKRFFPRRTSDDLSAEGVNMSCSEEFRTSTFLVIIDSLLVDLDKRIKAYLKVDKMFSFLRHTDVEAEVSLNAVVDFYSGDLEGLGEVENEWFQWRSLLKNLKVTACSPTEMLKLMLQNDFSTSFPNTYILLRHYLTLPVTNCASERSFSHLKRIKSAVRSTQTQDRLNNLALLNIESDVLQELDFSAVIDTFSSAKCRKRSL
jgi:hypothetical protein